MDWTIELRYFLETPCHGGFIFVLFRHEIIQRLAFVY